jgi:hypothetical protein
MFDNFIRGIVTDKGLKVYEANAVMAEAHP